MWIRSQDRKILTKIDDLAIDGTNQIWGDCCLLGKYSSKEKALKILDEIQTCIMTEHRFCTEDVNCIGKYFTKEWKEIYQMPQDEDVKL